MKYFNKKHARFSLINATVAIILFFIAQTIYVLPGQDNKAFFYGPIVNDFLFKNEPNLKDIVFINTHYDNMIVDNLDEHGFSNGNTVITDRNKLIKFTQLLQQENSYKYVVFDIFFEDKSMYDRKLSDNLNKLKNVILPRKDSLNKTLVDFRYLNLGLGTITKAGDIFFKYKLFNNSINGKSLPLKMYEDLNNVNYTSYGPVGFLDGQLVLNDFVPNIEVSNYDLYSKKYSLYNLSDFIKDDFTSADLEFYRSIIKNKILVIGNYETDIHSTIYGEIPGSLILINTFLSLEKGANTITILLIICLWFIFFFFSFLIIKKENNFKNRLLKYPVSNFLLTSVTYFLVFTIVSILVYLIFGNNISLTLVTIFFFLERLVVKNKSIFRKKEKLK
ncbi:CHASE2 domain-containing protein [Maribacter sp. Hel_I_7]|uniref:CHASE2 domain-containing protein n=1 Tax=Maribacter sp. Hel_I_7 TaxID=1249997 RepID=UPI00047A6FA7|nr:CHASE2 domain-containing protein [Maribacter sp. Hel_I_7]